MKIILLRQAHREWMIRLTSGMLRAAALPSLAIPVDGMDHILSIKIINRYMLKMLLLSLTQTKEETV